jgi:C4-dicarboxylate-specific signal transduction histidine kinase/ligand-binding sensor domain-containing protein/ActR/RegA family two-component response regulator
VRFAGWLAATVLGIVVLPTAAAADAYDVPHGLIRFRSFGSAEGLHNLVIQSITQDANGYLWIATDDGVSRYDGEKFTHFGVDQGLLSTVSRVVGVAPDGNVCVGDPKGVVCWDGTRFAVPDPTFPRGAVHAIASDRGRLWIGAANGLYVRDERGKFVRAPGWRGTTAVKALWTDVRGLVVGDDNRVVISDGDGAWRELSDIGLSGERVESVLRDRAGALWIRSATHIWRLQPGGQRVEDLTAGFPAGPGARLNGDMVNGPHGEVWFGSDAGVAFREGDQWRVIDRSAGLPSPGAWTLFVDREGTMWVGSVGLYQQRGRGLIERYDASNGLPGDVAWSFARDRDGALWVGTNRCLARMRNGRWECLPVSENRVVRSFVFPPQGGVFFGGAPADLVYIDPEGKATSLGGELVHPVEQAILALKLAPDGDLWIATRVGLFRLPGARPGPFQRVVIPGIPADAWYSTLLVAEGHMWVASSHGIAALRDGTWRVYGTEDGFHAPWMRYLVHTHDREYCVAYAEAVGVTCFDVHGDAVANVRHIGVAQGLITGSVYFLGGDRSHRLWIGTGDGVSVPTRRGMDHFGESDGVAGNDSTANAFMEDTDGSLWLGSTGGVTHLHAQSYEGPPAPPQVVMRGGRIGDRVLRGRDVALETPHDRNAITLEFGSDRLTDADRIEYQVRMSPLETEWTSTRTHQARYPSLPPAAYTFEVRARIGAGAWGPITKRSFVVRPAWWQSRWVMALACIATLLAIVAIATSLHRRVLRRRTRQLNEETAASVRALLEFVPDLISVHRDGKVIYCNRAARRLYGFDDAVAEHSDLGERIHPDDRARVADMLRGARHADADSAPVIDERSESGGRGPGGVARGGPPAEERRGRDEDGSWRLCEVSGVWMELAGATVLVASGRDVTERHQLRAQLLVSDRMASLGTLAAGIAHEINNPLSYVLGNLEVMAEALGKTDRSDPLVAAIGDATDGAQRVRKIVQGLRTFSRSEEEKRVPLEIPDVLRAAIRLTANEVRHRAQLVCELGATPTVLADDGRLTQVFINLIVNAAHAIPEGRSDENRITVRTRRDELGRAVIEVIDTGRGMTADVQARVFDPFYTTKKVGEGTGLGLSICHSIVTALGGQITLEGAVGRGAVARVVLPPAAVTGAAGPRQTEPKMAPLLQRLRVLVVDDEPRVAEMLQRVLRRDHEVVAVACGRDALEQVQAGVWFDAIVTDVMMPNMTGLELLDELVQIAPEQAKRLILLSGGVFTPETRARLDEIGTLQLEKPTNSNELRRAVMTIATRPSAPELVSAAS